MTSTPPAVTAYFEAWAAKDPEILRPFLSDDVVFDGPLAQLQGADTWIEALRGLFDATSALEVKHRWVDGADTLTWFDLEVGGSGPMPTTNWTHLEDGLITHVRVAFDPRPMLG